jgi:hypothetical protein
VITALVTRVWAALHRRPRDFERGDAGGRYLPSEKFFDAHASAFGPDATGHVDVERDFKKP